MPETPPANSAPGAVPLGDRRTWPLDLALVALAVVVVAVSARVSVPVPGSPVPQSLQTLAVVLVGAALGAGRGSAALALYVLAGALGMPVFADGAAGAAHLVGPTAGYLVGFVAAAALIGWGEERGRSIAMPEPWTAAAGFARTFLLMVLGHAIILALGWLRLSIEIGILDALDAGVFPFLWGGVAKSALGAAMWMGWQPWRTSPKGEVDG